MAKPQGSGEPSKKRQAKHYLILLLVILILVGVGFWAVLRNQPSSTTSEYLQSGSVTSGASSSVVYSASLTIGLSTERSSSTAYVQSLQPSDFNNLSYTGCILKSSGHTYLDLRITVTNRLNATVNYLNASIIVQASQISNGFHSSGNYTEQVSGATSISALEFSLSVPIDNVVSGSVTVEVFVEGASNQVVPIILHPSIPLSPSDYQQCT